VHVLVALVERHPRDRPLELGGPRGEQAGLAGAGRGRQQGARRGGEPVVQPGEQAGAGDEVGAGTWHEQLGREQGEARDLACRRVRRRLGGIDHRSCPVWIRPDRLNRTNLPRMDVRQQTRWAGGRPVNLLVRTGSPVTVTG
jgi:hypothetical protein